MLTSAWDVYSSLGSLYIANQASTWQLGDSIPQPYELSSPSILTSIRPIINKIKVEMPETPELHAEPTQCESAGEAMPDIAGVGVSLSPLLELRQF